MKSWRGVLAVYVAGGASALALPPSDAWWLLYVVVPLFVFRLTGVQRPSAALREGWLFGFGYFCVALHWIGYAFFVDATTYLWMMPIAVGGLAAVMAIYWGLAAATAHYAGRYGFAPWLAFPAALSGFEWLRGHLMTGFPWAVPGLAADGMGPVAQSAALVGEPGLTLLVLTSAGAVLPFIVQSRLRDRVAALAPLILLLASFVYGILRETTPLAAQNDVVVRIVQPNIPQVEKWQADSAAKVFDGLIAASTAPSADGLAVTHIVWPESAVPFLVDESAGARAVIRGALAGGKTLITGAIRRTAPSSDADFFTSVLVFDDAANVASVYDKWRLVPGGEFLPLAWLLEPLGFRKLVDTPGGFTAGTGPKTVHVPHAGDAGMLICYEAIFPHRLLDPLKRPNWLINVTNDGWFGTSTGPYQHLAQARLRAIEQGLPMVRSANTGISALIDARGKILGFLPIGVAGVLDMVLPPALVPTLYARIGDVALLGGLLMVMLLQLVSRPNCR